MSPLRFGLAMGVAIGLLGIQGTAARAQRGSASHADTLQVFQGRVFEYMALHDRIERGLFPLGESPGIHAILARRAQWASAIKGARPNARQGDVFTSDVANVIRGLIARALEGVDAEALLADLYAEDSVPSNFHVRVHDRYPAWATHEMPPVLLHRLPSLPAGLRYQLIDHDLVLWDMDADLVVDVVPDAIVRPAGSEG